VVMIFGDNLHRSKTAVATYAIAALSLVSFLITTKTQMIAFAFVPIEFSLHPALSAYRLVTAQFMHIDAIHLIGNLIFLLAFGRSVENLIGARLFFAACVGLGAFSFLGSWLISPDSQVPIVGASGSLSFLMGAYSIIFPKAKLRIIPLLRKPYLSAWLFSIVWVLLQVWSMFVTGENTSGVAYATHLAGFAIGIVAGGAWKEFALDTDRLIEKLNHENKT